jgi:hypothetical protein
MAIKGADSFAGLADDVSSAVEDAGGSAKAVVDSVAGVLAAALRESVKDGASPLSDETSALAGSVVRGASKAGGDLASVARGFLLGVLRESGLTGEPALDAAVRAVGAFIEGVHEVGGDAAGAAMGLVEGAMAWAVELKQDAARTAAAAGQAAVDAAYDVDAKTGARVRDALKVGIAGVTFVLKEPLKVPKK